MRFGHVAMILSVMSHLVDVPMRAEVLSDHSGERYRLRVELVPKTDFVDSTLLVKAKAFLASVSELDFARLWIVTRREDGELRGLPATHTGYATFAAIAKELQEMSGDWRFAEVFVVRGAGVLRVRHAGGQVRRLQLTGSMDPLRVAVGTRQIDIRWVSFSNVGGVLTAMGPRLQNVAVFATTADKVDVDVAERAFVAMKARIPHLTFELNLSTLPWFPFSSEFPLLFPFDYLENVPTEEAYERARGVVCHQIDTVGPRPRPRCVGGEPVRIPAKGR